ncbi:hypothetical protein pb186bvf_002356 [Paramecium bursaria]
MTEIQAVILADFTSFVKQPMGLLPICGDHLIDLQLNWIIQNKLKSIKEIYILSSHPQIEKQTKKYSQVRFIQTQPLSTIGDQLRELEQTKIIQNDFLLIFGDIITNIQLGGVLNRYFQNKEKNKLNIMLMVVHQGNQEENIFYVNNDDLLGFDNSQSKATFKRDKIKIVKGIPINVSIRSDLVESGIYVCSRDVLKSFQENQLFIDLKEDFMKEMLNSDIQEEKISIYITKQNEISQKLNTPYGYYLGLQQYLNRLITPLHPDLTNYEDFFKYFGQQTQVAKANISQSSYVGSQTIIGVSTIKKSIIGKGCKIGNGCKIINSIIWDNTIIQDKVIIQDAIICNNVTLQNEDQSYFKDQLLMKTLQLMNLLFTKRIISRKSSLGFGQNIGDKYIINYISQTPLNHNDDDSNKSFNSEEQNEKERLQEEKDLQSFKQDILELVKLTEQNDDSIQQTIVNIETMKVNNNRSCVDIINGFMPQILQFLEPNLEKLQKTFELWKDFLNRFISGDQESQTYFNYLEQFCRQNDQFYLHQLLQFSYQFGTLTDEQIIKYSGILYQVNDDFSNKFQELNKNFYDHLIQSQQYEYYEEEEEEQIVQE